MKILNTGAVLGVALLAATAGCAEAPVYPGLADAGAPVQNVAFSHGNLRTAQEMLGQAYVRLEEAQRANDSRLGGHAARAKELLREASLEIGAAAETAESR